MEGEGTSLVQF